MQSSSLCDIFFFQAASSNTVLSLCFEAKPRSAREMPSAPHLKLPFLHRKKDCGAQASDPLRRARVFLHAVAILKIWNRRVGYLLLSFKYRDFINASQLLLLERVRAAPGSRYVSSDRLMERGPPGLVNWKVFSGKSLQAHLGNWL